MDKIITIIIGLFLYTIFGGFVNDLLYYLFFSWKYVVEASYFVFSILGLSGFGIILLNLLFYVPTFLIGYLTIKKVIE